jgi:hypothetical protein
MSSTTEKPKELGITPGVAQIGSQGLRKVVCEGETLAAFGSREPVDEVTWKRTLANARLYMEAHNVANETGLTPRMMMEKLREAEHALLRISRLYSAGEAYREIASEAIAKLQPTK